MPVNHAGELKKKTASQSLGKSNDWNLEMMIFNRNFLFPVFRVSRLSKGCDTYIKKNRKVPRFSGTVSRGIFCPAGQAPQAIWLALSRE